MRTYSHFSHFFNSSCKTIGNNYFPHFDKYILFLCICFVISRCIFLSVGVRFDISTLPIYWQFIDPELLKSNLLESIFYLHNQPPLFNLFLGIILKVFPHTYSHVFHLFYLLCGLAITIMLYLLIIRLGVRRSIACFFTILFIISPPCIIYENWLFYTYPLCTMLLLLVILFQQLIQRPTLNISFAFFSLTAIIALTRSLFHFVWMLLLLCIIISLCKTNRKRIIIGAVLPFALVFAVYAKNAIVFNSFGVSSWFGMNISKIMTFHISEETQKELISTGVISELARITPFSSISNYNQWFADVKSTGIPILDNKYKSSGAVNYNYIGLIDIYSQYGRDSIEIFKRHPSYWIQGVLRAFIYYFYPAQDLRFFPTNRNKIDCWDTIFSRVVYGQYFLKADTDKIKSNYIGVFHVAWIILFLYSFSLGACLYIIWKSKKTNTANTTTSILFMLAFQVVWVTIIGNIFELGENQRFRFMIDPYYYLLIAYTTTHINFIDKIKRIFMK